MNVSQGRAAGARGRAQSRGGGGRILAVAAAACVAVLPGASAVAASRPVSGSPGTFAVTGLWGKAQEVPGTAILNTGGNAQITAVSCAKAGYCGAGGSYTVGLGFHQAFVVSEVKGAWGKAEEVPGTAALNKDGNAQLTAVSCASPGYCGAGGYYYSTAFDSQPFVVSEVRGIWGKAEAVPGIAALNTGTAEITSVSCASASSCSAGGYFSSKYGQQAFVVSKVNGIWRKAAKVTGASVLASQITAVSCAKAGDCSAGGTYATKAGSQPAFVVGEVNGAWRKAAAVTGAAAPASGSRIESVSCASVGNCSAAGVYINGFTQVFLVDEVSGTWRKAEQVRGTLLHSGGAVGTDSVSCASAGNCSAVGSYTTGFLTRVFVVNEVKGSWGKPEEVPGLAALHTGDEVTFGAVSCASAGNCSAGGYYYGASGTQTQAFVVSEVNGTWHKAQEVPGTATLNKGFAGINSVSCASAGNCGAGGYYQDKSGNTQALVVSET